MRIRFLNYDMPGLTFQGPLAQFWGRSQEQRPEFELWWAFRCVLIASTQFNGSFYRRLPQAANASGAGALQPSRLGIAFATKRHQLPRPLLRRRSGGVHEERHQVIVSDQHDDLDHLRRAPVHAQRLPGPVRNRR